jgi:hypothetical protein
MDDFPIVLEPMAEDRRRLLVVLDLIDESTDAVIRADLAGELVAVGSRYEDVKARAVYPALNGLVGNRVELDRAEAGQVEVRLALADIHARTSHVKPADAHLDDPAGFESALELLVSLTREHIAQEDAALFPMLSVLDDDEVLRLNDDVTHAVAHALSSPTPPENAIGRAAIAIAQKLDHLIEHDESDPWHPGLDKLDEELSRTEPQ